MEPQTCRLLPFETAGGPENMAADEVLLEAAAAGLASLRFYGWSEATISLGYFQAAAAHLQQPLHAGLPFVRRPSGGAALLHDSELTYCLALPAGARWQGAAPWPCRMHAIIGSALEELGIRVRAACAEAPASFTGFLCFAHQTPGDLLLGGSKVVGSAQRRQRGALIQHGGILLGTSRLEPALAGIDELSGRTLAAGELREAVARAFVRDTGWELTPTSWAQEEPARVAELVAGKYGQSWWNGKR